MRTQREENPSSATLRELYSFCSLGVEAGREGLQGKEKQREPVSSQGKKEGKGSPLCFCFVLFGKERLYQPVKQLQQNILLNCSVTAVTMSQTSKTKQQKTKQITNTNSQQRTFCASQPKFIAESHTHDFKQEASMDA